MSSVRWGLLSTANINQKLIPAIRASKRGELTGIASRSESSAKAYAAEWDIPEAYGSYTEMLDSKSIDAVYIGLPNHLHAEWSIKAMDAGKHVLCEKPLALSVVEVDQMIDASCRNQRVLTEAFMYRHHPQTKKIGDWVKSGNLGELSLIRSIFNFRLENPKNVRMIPEYGGGSLWDVGVYPISLCQYIYEDTPESVYGWQLLSDTGVDMTFVGQMHYSNNRVAQISSSFRTPFHTHAEIVGTEGRLTVNRPFNMLEEDPLVLFASKTGELIDLSVPHKELYIGEVDDMHAAIIDGTEPYINVKESRDHIRTVIALYKSVNEGKLVVL